MREIFVLGAGGHARVVADTLERLNISVAGFVSPVGGNGSQKKMSPVAGDDDWLLSRDPVEVRLVNGLGGLEPSGMRVAAFEKFKEKKFEFLTVIDPNAIVSKYATVGEGSFVAAGAVLQARARIEQNCVVNTGALVDHDCYLEDHVQVAPGAVLAGEVRIRRGAYVGLGAKILQGRVVGEFARVAAGAVVVSDVPPNKLVMGIPARSVARKAK